jgi:hypothetical protein
MGNRLTRILVLSLGAALLAGLGLGGAAEARAAYVTSTPVLSATPHKDKPFRVSGFITPKSTAASRARVKIILWMENGSGGYGIMDVYWAKLGKRPGGKPGSAYWLTITIPMKGDHGVQAVQYRDGKKVSSSKTTYFTVQP